RAKAGGMGPLGPLPSISARPLSQPLSRTIVEGGVAGTVVRGCARVVVTRVTRGVIGGGTGVAIRRNGVAGARVVAVAGTRVIPVAVTRVVIGGGRVVIATGPGAPGSGLCVRRRRCQQSQGPDAQD